MTADLEHVRQRYRPPRVKVLLVGESPPASGRFFYIKSGMTTYTARAFEKVQGSEFGSTEDFLNYFQDQGCYLEDLSHEPVDNLKPAQRKQRLREAIDGLAGRIRTLSPEVVVIVLKKIEPHVKDALWRAGHRGFVYTLPFPGNGHQTKFIDQMAEIVVKHIK